MNTSMPAALRPHYFHEIASARREFAGRNYLTSWRHLERAHIIGQPYPVAHTAVHLRMLWFGIRLKKLWEIVGQIPRLIFGGVKSFVGRIPVGNTGGADVSALKPMPIPADLAAIIASAGRTPPTALYQ
jgi:hypothetical protein